MSIINSGPSWTNAKDVTLIALDQTHANNSVKENHLVVLHVITFELISEMNSSNNTFISKENDAVSASEFITWSGVWMLDKVGGGERRVDISLGATASANSSVNSGLTFFECSEGVAFDESARDNFVLSSSSKESSSDYDKKVPPPFDSLTVDLVRTLFIKDLVVLFLSFAIAITAPYLIYLHLQQLSEVNRTFLLFETKFGSMVVQTIASLVSCEEQEDVARSMLYEWYE